MRDVFATGQKPDRTSRWILAGPQVYGVAFCRLDYSDRLKEMGFAGP